MLTHRRGGYGAMKVRPGFKNMNDQNLSEIEWTLLWASLRYFVGRQTIAAASYPADVIKHYYARMNNGQRERLACDIYEHFERCGCVGDPKIDQPIWLKFAAALDSKTHFQKTLSDGSSHVLFSANDRIYPLSKYLSEPHLEIYLQE